MDRQTHKHAEHPWT